MSNGAHRIADHASPGVICVKEEGLIKGEAYLALVRSDLGDSILNHNNALVGGMSNVHMASPVSRPGIRDAPKRVMNEGLRHGEDPALGDRLTMARAGEFGVLSHRASRAGCYYTSPHGRMTTLRTPPERLQRSQ